MQGMSINLGIILFSFLCEALVESNQQEKRKKTISVMWCGSTVLLQSLYFIQVSMSEAYYLNKPKNENAPIIKEATVK